VIAAAAFGKFQIHIKPKLWYPAAAISEQDWTHWRHSIVLLLESKGTASHVAFSFVDELNLSKNDIGDDGISCLPRAIAKRIKIWFVDRRVSTSNITVSSVATIVNLNHWLSTILETIVPVMACRLYFLGKLRWGSSSRRRS
jgi:hypothetical protein